MRALIFSDSHGDEANLRWMAELAAQRRPHGRLHPLRRWCPGF